MAQPGIYAGVGLAGACMPDRRIVASRRPCQPAVDVIVHHSSAILIIVDRDILLHAAVITRALLAWAYTWKSFIFHFYFSVHFPLFLFLRAS